METFGDAKTGVFVNLWVSQCELLERRLKTQTHFYIYVNLSKPLYFIGPQFP